MKKYFTRVLAATLALCMLSTSALAIDFTDIRGHWAESDILRWESAQLLKGYPDKSFRPNNPVTRGEMATVIDRILRFETLGENIFSDLDNGFYRDPMLKAYHAQIFLGDDLRQMRPNDYITRQEAVAVLGRAFGVRVSDRFEIPKYKDYHSIADWAIGYVLEMSSKAYVAGRTDGTFDPLANITRGEIVRILTNTMTGYYDKPGTYTDNIAGTAVINIGDVTLKNMTVRGDLIIAEGVASGDVTLDGVSVLGEVFVRGGGPDSVLIKSNSNISSISLGRTAGKLSLKIIEPAAVGNVEVTERSNDVTIYGSLKTLNVNAPLAIVDSYRSNIGQININASKSNVRIDNYSRVGQIVIEEAAQGVKLSVNGRAGDVAVYGKEAEVDVRGIVGAITTGPTTNLTKLNVQAGGGVSTIDISGTNNSLNGDGRIEIINVKGNNTIIQTVGSELVVSPGVTGTEARGRKIAAGTSQRLEGNLPYVRDPETGDVTTLSTVTIEIDGQRVNVGKELNASAKVSPSHGLGGDYFKWKSSNEQVGRVVSTSNTTVKIMALAPGTFDVIATSQEGSVGTKKIVVYSEGGVCYIGDNYYPTLAEAIDDADLSDQSTTIHLLPEFYKGKEIINIAPTTNSKPLTIMGLGKASSTNKYSAGIKITRPNVTVENMNLVITTVDGAVALPVPVTDNVPPIKPSSSTGAAGAGDITGIYIAAQNVTVRNMTVDIKVTNTGRSVNGIFVDERLGALGGFANVELTANAITAANGTTGGRSYGIYSLSSSSALTANTITASRALGIERLTTPPNVSGNLFNASEFEVVYHGLDTLINSPIVVGGVSRDYFGTATGGRDKLSATVKEILSTLTYQMRGSKKIMLASGANQNLWSKMEYYDYSSSLNNPVSLYYNKAVDPDAWEHVGGAAFDTAKALLTTAVTTAEALHDGAIEGTAAGQFPGGSKANLLKGISIAKTALIDPIATAGTFATATSVLEKAVATFRALQIQAIAQPAPAALTFGSKTYNSVVLKTPVGANVEYAYAEGAAATAPTSAWDSSASITGLKPNTDYSFFARIKGTPTHLASPASPGLSEKTEKVKITAVTQPNPNIVLVSGTPLTKPSIGTELGTTAEDGAVANLTAEWTVDGDPNGFTGNIGNVGTTYILTATYSAPANYKFSKVDIGTLPRPVGVNIITLAEDKIVYTYVAMVVAAPLANPIPPAAETPPADPSLPAA